MLHAAVILSLCPRLLALVVVALGLGGSVCSASVVADRGTVCTKKADCSTDINATRTFRRWPEPNIVPWPRTISASAAYSTLTGASAIVAVGRAVPVAHLLAGELSDMTRGALNLTVVPTVAAGSAGTLSLMIDPSSGDFYSVDVDPGGATLTAATYEGLVAATATLLQILEYAGDDDGYPAGPYNCSTASAWRLPHLTIRDGPEFTYRGLMVDCARNHVPLAALKQFVVLCRFYKLNCKQSPVYRILASASQKFPSAVSSRSHSRLSTDDGHASTPACSDLHLHLTDDQSFTFPSAAFPQLAAKSSFSYTLGEC